jgi:hypothetical protein
MGWDGKPIPYWLYKLHGLGQVTSLVSAYLELLLVSIFQEGIPKQSNIHLQHLLVFSDELITFLWWEVTLCYRATLSNLVVSFADLFSSFFIDDIGTTLSVRF